LGWLATGAGQPKAPNYIKARNQGSLFSIIKPFHQVTEINQDQMLSELPPGNHRRDKYLTRRRSKAVWCGVAWDCEAAFAAASMGIANI
jgi:hypothetical protein